MYKGVCAASAEHTSAAIRPKSGEGKKKRAGVRKKKLSLILVLVPVPTFLVGFRTET